jgi:hypothetical protein
MKKLLAGLVALGVVLAVSAAGTGASVGFHPSGVIPLSGSAPATHVARTAGPFTCGSISCSAYETGVNQYLQDVAADSGTGNNVYSTDTQYSDNTGSIAYNSTFGGTYEDTNAFPANGCPTGAASRCLTESQLVDEIDSVMTSQGWTANGSNLFFIMLPDGVNTCFDSGGSSCASNAFCAYHDSSGSLLFAVEPFAAGWSCDASFNGQGFPNGPEIDQTVNVISHEHNEAITDPNQAANAWLTSNGWEIGDLCAWSFGAALGTTAGGEPYNQVINGHDYSLQLEYSNAANSNTGGCVEHLGGTATPISYGGPGPLNWYGGPVMRTNTTYTIYWIPTTNAVPTPEISAAPIVAGTAAIGKQLASTTGTWTNSPTSFSYHWQRCDNTGANCANISGATTNRYTLVAADAGHEIRSTVRASNSAGPSSGGFAPSDPTAVVVGKPKIITKPVLSGTTTVGMQLSVSTGSWTYSPTSYTYHWLRCTASGGACISLSTTGSSYTLKSGDIGHTLKAQVTAKNAAGSSAASTTTKSTVVTR